MDIVRENKKFRKFLGRKRYEMSSIFWFLFFEIEKSILQRFFGWSFRKNDYHFSTYS